MNKEIPMTANSAAGNGGLDSTMAALDDLDLGDEEIIEELDTSSADNETETIDEVVPDDDLQNLENEINKVEAYEAIEGEDTEISDALLAKTSKPKTAKTKRPAVVRDLASIDAEHFVLFKDDEMSDEDFKTTVISLKPSQKKIAEKFDNIFISLANNRKPSTFVMKCLNIIKTPGTLWDSKTLQTALQDSAKKNGEKYSKGTAASQVGQIMQLFPLLKITTPSNGSLKFNDKSVIAEKLLKL